MHDNLIILAGGASSRMKKEAATKSVSEEENRQANERSKGLIGVGQDGRPLLDYLLCNAKKAGYKNIYFIIGEQGKLFEEYFGNTDGSNDFHGLNIYFAIQYIPAGRIKPFGTADALFQAVEQFPNLNSQYYTVCNSDNLYSVNALQKLRETDSPNAFISYDRDALEFSSDKIARFALAKLDKNGYLLDIVEKPAQETLENFRDSEGKLRVSMNIFKFDGEKIYPFLKNCPVHPVRNEKELPTVILHMLEKYPKSMIGIPMAEHVPDLTAKEDIAEVKKFIEENYPRLNWNF